MQHFVAALVLTFIASVSFADPLICIGTTDSNEQVGFGYFSIFKSIVLLHSGTGTKLQVYAQDLAQVPASSVISATQINYGALVSVSAQNASTKVELTVEPGPAATRLGIYTQTDIASGQATAVPMSCTIPAN